MTVADRIKECRENLGLTQTELANMMGCKDKSTVSRIESSGNDVSMRNIKRIAPVLKTTPSYLLGWDDHENVKPLPSIDKAGVLARISMDNTFMESVEKYWKLNPEHKKTISDNIDYLYDREGH